MANTQVAYANWIVEPGEDDDGNQGIIVTFQHLSETGVEQFQTSFCPTSAVEFAEAVTSLAAAIIAKSGSCDDV